MRLSKTLFVTILALAVPFYGQAPATPKPTDITVKVTPASSKLIEAAKETSDNIKNFNKALDTAKNTQAQAQKDNQKQIETLSKELNDKLKADKKYKPYLDQLQVLSKAQQDSGTKAQADFNRSVQPIQQKIAQDSALIQGLIPIVREENSLPDTTSFNLETQKWTDTKKEK